MADDARTLLRRLARAHGVQWRYTGQDGSEQTVPDEALVQVLAALGVQVRPDGVAALTEALDDADTAPWRDVLPPTVAVREGHRLSVPAHVAAARSGLSARVVAEDGTVVPVEVTAPIGDERRVDGVDRVRVHLEVPAGLPQGWHRLELDAEDGHHAESVLVCAPERLTTAAPFLARRGWGVAAQGYSVTSTDSWGIGDLHDAAEVGLAARAHGADFLLLHPLHAVEPGPHPADSPYSPVTRRFLSALAVRVTDIPEFSQLPTEDQERLRRAGAQVQARLEETGRIDRTAVAEVLWPALRAVHAVPRCPEREAAYARFRDRMGPGLDDFALWSAVRVVTGTAGPDLQDPAWAPGGEAAARFRTDHAQEVDLHRWVQWIADEQLAAAQGRLREAGMRMGVMVDLAVGATRCSADAWMLGDVLVPSMSVGAPPETFNQLGQDWSQHPWHPRRLAETGYAAFRDMLRSVLAHAGGIRMDHVLGLFRLWWVPEGSGPTHGAYVEYDHEAMLAVLTLEAERAGAVVIGEDLGTFEPWVQRRLAEAGVLGTSILWFEQAEGVPTPPERYRRLCMAAVNTHDLPPTAGYLEGVHLDLRERLGLFTGDVATERRRSAEEVRAYLDAARERGLLEGPAPDGADDRDAADVQTRVTALHRLLSQAPSALHCVALVDAVGERRIQNQPGTLQEQYPNWTVPLADGAGRLIHTEDLPGLDSAARLFDAVEQELRTSVPVGIAVAFHTSPLAQPGGGDAGGMNVYVRQAALALAQQGVRMILLTRATEPLDGEPLDDGSAGARVTALLAGGDAPDVVVVELPAGPAAPVDKAELPEHTEAFTQAALAWLRAQERTGALPPGQVRFVHGHYWLSAPTAHAVARELAAPHVQTMHTTAAVKMRQDAGHHEPAERVRAERRVAEQADLLVVNSPAEAAELREVLDADRRRVRVLAPGVDTAVFTPDGPVSWPGAQEAPLKMVFAGRIQSHKGPQLLVEALGLLRRPAPGQVHLHVVGAPSGDGGPDLAALAAEHGVAEQVTFSPPLGPEELAAVFRAADLVAMPSASETYGLVALEAQACGTPVLAHRVGGLVHAVQDGVSGRLVHPNTAEAWARALAGVLADRAAWDALAPAAVRHARAHTWQRWAEGLLEAVGRMPAAPINAPGGAGDGSAR
ncbi:4-alpha-glucanotransferase [Micrococcus sp.]|uniref:4-alpha-glucanotransferase n=1 Tax=Micrococcus sp. TaxID=1271 RepID=UPI002A91983E|nr:4-alpha-glucanotransferase [Micrococcus sp.]MDY6055386.1 4-alpha-glucanotransferase [Micrococcus sp.]